MSNEKSPALQTTAVIDIVGVSGKKYTFTVRKLPLGKVINLLQTIEKLPKEIADIDKMNESEILQNIAQLVALAIPQFIGVIAEAIDDEKITQAVILEEFGFDDIVEVVFTILQVNNVVKIFQTIKKMQALTKAPQAPQAKIG